MNQARLAVRVNPQNPDHHLWNNHGIWWCHFTLHSPQFTKQRLRRSLGTRCVQEAREIRDFLLATSFSCGATAVVQLLPVNL